MDWCTLFPEKWVTWKFKVVDISECCKGHDDTLSTGSFYKCLSGKIVLGASLITLGGAIGAWAKYPLDMLKRL